ncbi:nuclear transport factor 2 family protein [Sphingomonas sp. CGMCC 1.13654]|uniref:Nuclear transport factor 2 family protein n=1 Tax=Sphingomonas chungangi TaxID=2683589 RepID=A0A838L643_9SPHN|nr:nuclear transport factor 2 family protein [Sphingomonas chungangi]MBA2934811.1 nuclear transport factor 2 family protein [Sphingomonas chungangi]MVW58122.1 DUF4440 domain-containing protein [Sphingomonas chungangi]
MMPQALADRAAIVDLVHLYAQAADLSDFDALVGCFTQDAVLEMASGTLDGREAIRVAITPAGGRPFDHSTHVIANITLRLDGDNATGETLAVAHLIGPGERIVTKGIGYTDLFRRTAEGWRISRRRHRTCWQVG